MSLSVHVGNKLLLQQSKLMGRSLLSLIGTMFFPSVGRDACYIYSKHPRCCLRGALNFVCRITNASSRLASGSHSVLLSLRANACAAALSASHHCLRSDWLINKLLNHQRQQPAGRRSPYFETFNSHLFQMVRWGREIRTKVTAGRWWGLSLHTRK